MKTWKPDTCECVVQEVYEGTTIKGGGQVIKKCTAHSSVADQDLYGVLYSNPDGENKVKNQMYRILLGYEEIKDLGLEEKVVKEDGSEVVEMKKGINYAWSFEGSDYNRKLKVEIKGVSLPKTKKDSIKALADNRFGNGKVEII